MTSNERPTANVLIFAADELQTAEIATRLARFVEPGTTIGLLGTLGAGKTRFVQAFAQACGVPPGTVVSPTYVLCQEYAADRFVIQHLDVYRLNSDEEFYELGSDELFGSADVKLIEWADKFAELLPDDRLEIDLQVTGETTRKIAFRAFGDSAVKLVSNLM